MNLFVFALFYFYSICYLHQYKSRDRDDESELRYAEMRSQFLSVELEEGIRINPN